MTITVWLRWNAQTRSWDFNHLSNGYDAQAQFPTPIDPGFILQRAWKAYKWRAFKAILTADRVVQYVAP